MEFKKFIRTKQNYEPAATIRRNGTLSFNRLAAEFLPEDKPYATLYSEKKEGLIGIKFAAEKEEHACKITRSKNGKGTPTISCQAFLNSMGISYREGSWLYAVTWDEKREMMIIKIG